MRPSQGASPSFLSLPPAPLTRTPPLPFPALQRRLARRLRAHGVTVVGPVLDEEWSYIPVGGGLPQGDNALLAFGAAANMQHPSTGYSITRSMADAPGLARVVAASLRDPAASPAAAAAAGWDHLWSLETRAQRSFQVFGMELLNAMDVRSIGAFFRTFFGLPRTLWEGFLSGQLSAATIPLFALQTFVRAEWGTRLALVAHLVRHPSARAMGEAYVARFGGDRSKVQK